jgi:ABC-type Fe3+-hydroxamate transport system substrate-binding protein
MITCTDQTGYRIELQAPARRIVSIVPSQTELLADLGLDSETVGITKFCIHPGEWFRRKKRVGGTKDVRVATVRDLQPDLILANKEENTREQVEALRAICPVWTSDISTLEDALDMIRAVGVLTDKEKEANTMAGAIDTAFNQLSPMPPLPCLYFIWRNPYMVAGGDTFIHEMLHRAGFKNLAAGLQRYPELTPDQVQTIGPEYILLSSEPYPFREKHIRELQEILPEATILLADGEMFSWYGSRLAQAPAYFEALRRQAGLTGP